MRPHPFEEAVMHRLLAAQAIAVAFVLCAATLPAAAQTQATPMQGMPMQGMPTQGMPMQGMPMQHGAGMMHGMGMQQGASVGAPRLAGQDAFGAVQEIVSLLEADPATDWSKVDLEALRQHLIDMNEVVLKATATPQPVDGGIAITVAGEGRTLPAIQRMIPAHATELAQHAGWKAKADLLANGALLTVTADDPKEVQHIRGLGFVGLMAEGGHHQAHHLAIAKGEMIH
jgi:hypothetical protein